MLYAIISSALLLCTLSAHAQVTTTQTGSTLNPTSLPQIWPPASCRSTCSSVLPLWTACTEGRKDECVNICQPSNAAPLGRCLACVGETSGDLFPGQMERLRGALEDVGADCEDRGWAVPSSSFLGSGNNVAPPAWAPASSRAATSSATSESSALSSQPLSIALIIAPCLMAAGGALAAFIVL